MLPYRPLHLSIRKHPVDQRPAVGAPLGAEHDHDTSLARFAGFAQILRQVQKGSLEPTGIFDCRRHTVVE